MVHQSLVTRPAVPSSTVPPETHPKPDVLDVFGSKDNVVREHFQRVLSLSALAMSLILMLIATVADARGLVLTAPLEPVRATTVYTELSGQMRDVRVQLGDVVVAGDTLAVIHSRDLELKEIIARVLMKKARAIESRLSEMYRRGLVSANQFESVRFDTEVAHYRWLAAYLNLEKTAITAPRNGLVVKVDVKVGDWVLSHTAVAQVIDPRDLQAQLFVPEDRLNAIRMNMPLSAMPTAGGKRALRGRIIEISPIIDSQNGTCKVTGLFLDAGKYVRPGALVNVTIGR